MAACCITGMVTQIGYRSDNKLLTLQILTRSWEVRWLSGDRVRHVTWEAGSRLNPSFCPPLAGYFDAHSLAMDFMSIGFRECLTEVARYLTSVEGLDTSDPLRVRLVSHLSTCASQREAAAMTSSMAHHHHPLHPHHWAAAFHHLPAALLQPNGLHASDAAPCRLSSDMAPHHGSALLTATFAHADAALRVPSAGSVAPCVPPLSTSLLSLSATVHAAAAAATAAAQSFPLSFTGAFPMLPPSAAAAAVAAATAITPPLAVSATASPQQAGSGGSTKPYRPWGTEVGAF